jgi:hypothetical protein
LTPKGVGAAVAAGEYLGVVGSSGCSTAPHLHFELYNAAGFLQDPYAGPCNSLNGSTWWAAQRPYYDSAINKLMTGAAASTSPACPQTETTYEKTLFAPGETIAFSAFFRDLLPGQVATFRLLRPDGSEFTSWTHERSAYWPVDGTFHVEFASLPTGTWHFAADFLGQSYEVPFEVAFGNAGRVSGLLLGKPTPTGLPLTWGGTCQSGVTSYAVYAGFIGDWKSHTRVSCDVTGTSFTVPPLHVQSDRYYLVVPLRGGGEGSYGQDSAGSERPQGISFCAIQPGGNCAGDPPGGATATITWTTDEPATSQVTYGLTPPSLPTSVEDLSLVTGHSLGLSDLLQCRTYFFWVSSADDAGNLAIDKNGGAYYSFDTACPVP